MSEETKLDLDALSAEEATNWEFGDLVREVNRLRQRLREAEAENERLLVDDGGAFTTAIRVKERRKLLNRIAQLEQVLGNVNEGLAGAMLKLDQWRELSPSAKTPEEMRAFLDALIDEASIQDIGSKSADYIRKLERVREAVIAYLDAYIDREALDAALAAVEEKP